MSEMDYKEVEEEEGPAFTYILLNDVGDIYLLQTDPSGRVEYRRWFLFNKHECNARHLADALNFIHKTVHRYVSPKHEEKMILDAISACRPVMKKIKNMSIW
jgi:hypothetical protein